MKKVLMLALALTLCAGVAMADHIGLYADNAGTNCNIGDHAPGLLYVYVVHNSVAGATAAEFKVLRGPGVTFSYISDTPGMATQQQMLELGNSNAGCSLAYTECMQGTFLILTITNFGSGSSSPCAELSMGPDPTPSPPVQAYVDCGGNLVNFQGSGATVNPDATCQCVVVPTKASTWGNIKALYR